MHAEVNVRVTVRIEEAKPLPLAQLAESVTELDLEAAVVEEAVHALDRQSQLQYCGPKHARGNGNERFQRGGTRPRTAVTTAGEHQFSLLRVRDTQAPAGENTYFSPIEDLISFDGQKIYQEDISVEAVTLATRLSYRDAAIEGGRSLSMPSPSTTNRRLIDYGDRLDQYLLDQAAETQADIVIPDGTYCHSQDEGRDQHHVAVTLGEHTTHHEYPDEDEDEGELTRDPQEENHPDRGPDRDEQGGENGSDPLPGRTLLDVSVDESWKDVTAGLEEIDAMTDQRTVVSDFESGLLEAFLGDDREDQEGPVHQPDLVHIGRTTKYKLWEEGVMPLEKRKEVVWEVTEELIHLKNSVRAHRWDGDGDTAAIQKRIEITCDRIDRTARQIDQLGNPKTAGFLRRCTSSLARFAEEAIEGRDVPWTSNVVERTMGEVSKRCKNQWMSWTEKGLESMLKLDLVRWLQPETYTEFVEDICHRSDKTAISCDVSVEATGGKL